VKRLHQNIGGYQGETIDIRAVLREFATTAMGAGWRGETFFECLDFSLTAWHRSVPSSARRIYISAGIHGDEPAAPLTALRLVRENRWPADAEIVLLPCLNPSGFLANRRENAGGLDLNRDYRHLQSPEIGAHVAWLQSQANFDLCLSLHEDWESNGFYLYELNPNHRPALAQTMVSAVAPVCPVDLATEIEGREAHGGIIRPNIDPSTRPLWPESLWLIQNRALQAYTLEAPSDFPLATRVDALTAAVRAALGS